MRKVKVKLNEDKPEPVEIIASAIIEIAESMKRINASKLNRRALVALIHDNSKVNKGVIEIVLNNLENLEKYYLKPRKVSL